MSAEERDEVLDREDLITAEEAVEEVVDQEDTEEVKQEEPESSADEEVVERAKKYGHLSKEEWIAQGKDPDQWKSPEEFDKTGKILEQLYSMRKKVDQRDREIQALVDYQKRTSQREYERAKNDLEQRLAASKDDMDVEGVAHYTKELTRLEDMEQQSHVQQSQQATQEAEQRFMERNQNWYNDRNPDLVARAHSISAELRSVYMNATPDELAQKIETRMKYEYPERVSGQVKSHRPTITQNTVNKKVNSGSKQTFQKLSQEHKDTFNVYKRLNPDVTESEFIARLKKDGEI